jgi:hypothetical protein
MMQALLFLWDHKMKILGTIGLVATTILQEKVQVPDLLTAYQTGWVAVIAQLCSAGTLAGGIAYSVTQAKAAAPPPPPAQVPPK